MLLALAVDAWISSGSFATLDPTDTAGPSRVASSEQVDVAAAHGMASSI